MSKEHENAKEAILIHAEGLAEEMNLRLLCEMESGIGFQTAPELRKLLFLSGKENLWKELCLARKVFWVEKVEVTVNSNKIQQK